jgi:hypothetical protein
MMAIEMAETRLVVTNWSVYNLLANKTILL